MYKITQETHQYMR